MRPYGQSRHAQDHLLDPHQWGGSCLQTTAVLPAGVLDLVSQRVTHFHCSSSPLSQFMEDMRRRPPPSGWDQSEPQLFSNRGMPLDLRGLAMEVRQGALPGPVQEVGLHGQTLATPCRGAWTLTGPTFCCATNGHDSCLWMLDFAAQDPATCQSSGGCSSLCDPSCCISHMPVSSTT